MDIKKNKAVVLKKDGAVIEISNHNYQIGQKISVNSHPYRKYMLIAASFILCVVTSVSGYALYNTPSSYVYVDINPSVRLDINCFERVIDVVPLNDDASKLVKAYSFKSRDAESCINDIVKACEEKKYLNPDNNDVELDVMTDKSNLKKKINSVSKALKERKIGVTVLNIDKDENAKAIGFNSSPKRLKAIEEYTDVFGGTLKDNATKLRGTSVKNIYSKTDTKQDIPSKTPIATEEKAASVQENSEAPKQGALSNQKPAAKTENNSQQNIEKKQSGTEAVQNTEAPKKEPQLNPSPKRLEAIEEYSKMFGGSVKENTEILKGKSVKEINAAIENQNKNKQADQVDQIDQADTEIIHSEKQDNHKPTNRKHTKAAPSENVDKKQPSGNATDNIPTENEKSDK